MQPSAKLDSLSGRRRDDAYQSTRDSGGCTERAEQALSVAFDRIWGHRTGMFALPDSARETEQDLPDAYILRNFRQVAQLGRESLCNEYRHRVLCQMRDDGETGNIATGLRCEVDADIKRVERNNQRLQDEISQLMHCVGDGPVSRPVLPSAGWWWCSAPHKQEVTGSAPGSCTSGGCCSRSLNDSCSLQ